ncbi:MAG: HAD family hydrolase [Candidatus Marinimicrobia bacterium]|nr:HAD family hydrolase [Candidatus Neomarinimicrobiota bacterium]MBL7010351.1 HAD family hydrolase [Candidatus Neomarinimicrobiota bacterium]MBL7030021.1 HAD family hydrolase [Candidatus Neomarinimicrobiota bacterium]
MKKYDTIFLDRDGTLNPDPGYINDLSQFEFYDFTIDGLKRLKEYGNRFCIITNQSGIGRGIIEMDKLSEIHDYILNSFYKNDLELLGIYYCPDHPDKATKFRKPGSGMFLEAAKDHNIEITKCLMMGDALSDIQAGVNLRMDTMLLLTGRGKETADHLGKLRPNFIAENILDGANLLLEHSSS